MISLGTNGSASPKMTSSKSCTCTHNVSQLNVERRQLCDCLEPFKVQGIPDSIYYIPNFVTDEEAEVLLSEVYGASKVRWKQLLNRRLQNWGGLPEAKGMVAEDLPAWLKKYTERLDSMGVFPKEANHVLVNEYQPGQGIMFSIRHKDASHPREQPHEDGPAFYPTVATITLGSHGVLQFYRHRRDLADDHGEANATGDVVFSLCLEKNSLVLVRDDCYIEHLHGIEHVETDSMSKGTIANWNALSFAEDGDEKSLRRGTRVSLTIRLVPNVISRKLTNALVGRLLKR